MDQSKLKIPGRREETSPRTVSYAPSGDLAEIALQEAIRLLDLLSKLNASLVPRLYPTVKKLFDRPISRSNSHIFLALLQYFVNHSDIVLYDPEPIFRAFFQQHIPTYFANPTLSFETFLFCNTNKKQLLSTSTVFSHYFPPLLKLFAWYPQTNFKAFASLLPALISPSTYVELFHYLLDLPLVATAMERSELERLRHEDAVMAGDEPPPSQMNERHRAIYNHLLRNEAGVSINFWDSVPLQLLHEFCQASPPSVRVLANASLVSTLLNVYFDVLIEFGDETCLTEVFSLIVRRMDQLYPLPSFQQEVRKVLVDKVMAIFRRYPAFVVSLKDLIVASISDSTTIISLGELILSLCWIVGEYANPALCPTCTNEVLNDYHEALELFAYERMSMVKLDSSEQFGFESPFTRAEQPKSKSGFDLFTTRLMLVVISSLAKLAARWQDLSSRVLLCLAKIMRHQYYFDPIVLIRANECMQLLKFPSIAPAILGSPLQSLEKRTSHIDENSSLPFLLLPSTEYVDGGILHPWTLG